VEISARVLPVDFAAARVAIEEEIAKGYDFALHLGQAAGSSFVRLEMFAVNAGCERGEGSLSHRPGRVRMPTIDTLHSSLAPNGPAAYQSSLPLMDWVEQLLNRGVPSEVSFHAGTYLCNAVFYWSQYFAERCGASTRAVFIHLPLAPCQAEAGNRDTPVLDVESTAAGVREILEELSAAAAT
jgi:pyroglutamyl-peptidase